MPTGVVGLFPGGHAPDGSGSGNNSAAIQYAASGGSQTANTPKASQLSLRFDDATDEHWLFQFKIPADYVSGGVLRGKCKFISATTGNAIMKAGQVTTIDSSTDDDALVFVAGDLSAAIAAPGTQGQVKEFTVTLTATNMAAGRKCEMFIGRDADNGSDTASGDLQLLTLDFEYTN